MLQSDTLEGVGYVLEVAAFRSIRITGGTAKCAGRHIWALRQQEHLCIFLHLDRTAAPGPQAGDGTHQRALARPRLARN